MTGSSGFCGQCGTATDSADKYCRECGRKLDDLFALKDELSLPRPALPLPDNNRTRVLAVATLVGLIVAGVLWLGNRTQGLNDAQLNTGGAATTTRAITETVAPQGSAENPVPIGRSAEVGPGWSLKFVEVKFSSKEDIHVDVEWTYTGQGASSLWSNGIGLHAIGGSTQYKYYSTTCDDGNESNESLVQPGSELRALVQEMFAGGKVSRQVCFHIEPADTNNVVVFSQSANGNVFFALR